MSALDSIPIRGVWRLSLPEAPMDSVAWCERFVRLPGSARSERFNCSITPWIREPLVRVSDGVTRIVTFVKPVQAGGSVLGECALCYGIGNGTGGDAQNNWEDDEKAGERWDKRIERILKACEPVMARVPSSEGQGRHKWKRGMVMFHQCNLTVQGTFAPDNLDSDSIRVQVNEEVHNWEPGRLDKAYRRTTAFWNKLIVNISNAGKTGDQLHQAWESGTMQHWEVKCPGCGKFHRMRTRWEDKHPKLGGLRYNADKARRKDGTYDYNKLVGTIRYQMPCGFQIADETARRRELSVGGRYCEPTNTGAPLSNRSYTLDGVAVDYIPWLDLIMEKHKALRALKLGDPEPWRRYLTERECRFWDPEDRPVVGRVVLSDRRKNRDGLKDRELRLCAVDRQRGKISEGELPHWWMVVRDVDKSGNSLLVWEGKLTTDENVVATIKDLAVMPRHVVVDSGDETTEVYLFCLRHGFNAIKGDKQRWYSHPDDGGRRIYSPERPLYLMINGAPTCENPLDEPQFWLYSKAGVRDRLAWLRASKDVKWEVPGDVSEDYTKHMEAEEEVQKKVPSTGEVVTEWVQVKERNDLFVCECYIAMLMDMAGLIAVEPEPKK